MTHADYMTIASLTGNLVIYRDLQPCDEHLPRLEEMRTRLALPSDVLPRKRDAAYAQIVFALLQQAQAQRGAPPLNALLVVGDTNNDRMMSHHLRAASGLPVFAFIGTEDETAAPACTWEGTTATANRWHLLEDWLLQVDAKHPSTSDDQPRAQTALLLDIDKTLLGPRGRSDHQIDEARAEAALGVAQIVLSADIDADAFHSLYTTLCRSEFHGLTLDNQDYTVYLTLLLASGTLSASELITKVNDGTFSTFPALLEGVAPNVHTHPILAGLQQEIQAACAAGDPTPFKAFRRAEFAATLIRMLDGRLPLCRDVVALAQRMGEQGALCSAASDKPAESALPTAEQQEAGFLPLHHTPVLTDQG